MSRCFFAPVCLGCHKHHLVSIDTHMAYMTIEVQHGERERERIHKIFIGGGTPEFCVFQPLISTPRRELGGDKKAAPPAALLFQRQVFLV